MAWKDGFLNPINAILTIVGVLMLHASVNVLNDYFDTSSQSLAILRSFSAIPAHGVFGATMGYFFMKYSFIRKQNNLALCMIVPILLHGSYNFFAHTYFIVSLLIVIVSCEVIIPGNSVLITLILK